MSLERIFEEVKKTCEDGANDSDSVQNYSAVKETEKDWEGEYHWSRLYKFLSDNPSNDTLFPIEEIYKRVSPLIDFNEIETTILTECMGEPKKGEFSPIFVNGVLDMLAVIRTANYEFVDGGESINECVSKLFSYLNNTPKGMILEARDDEGSEYCKMLSSLVSTFKKDTGKDFVPMEMSVGIERTDYFSYDKVLFNKEKVIDLNNRMEMLDNPFKGKHCRNTINVISENPYDYRFAIPLIKKELKLPGYCKYFTGKMVFPPVDSVDCEVPLKIVLIPSIFGPRRYSKEMIDYLDEIWPATKECEVFELNEDGELEKITDRLEFKAVKEYQTCSLK